MTPLPTHIEILFFRTLKGDTTLHEFERWLYENKELESLFNADDYLELISLNFKGAGAKYDLWKMLAHHVDLGKYEKFKLLEQLEEAKRRTPELPYLLMVFYDLYCEGYNFLEDLGMAFGLRVQVPEIGGHIANEWGELTQKDQDKILQSFYPQLDGSLDRAIEWLRTGQILLTGVTDEHGFREYIDHRTEEQRKSDIWETVSEKHKVTVGLSKGKLGQSRERPVWWQFWK